MLLSQHTPVRPIEERMPRPATRALKSVEVYTLPRSLLSRIRLNSDYAEKTVKPRLRLLLL
ncbi:hypothetical protein ASPU41_20105 (plasmid) [Arthrobacter sp. U41]|nr:hypothetical protein ASPU41_20105 [Arthrobacter sp. U41]